MSTKPKRIAWALAGTIALFPLAACGGNPQQEGAAQQQEQTSQTENTTANSTQSQAPATHDWRVNIQTASLVSEESRAVFESAVQDWTGSTLNPIAEVATQVVSGTNHMYLCTSTPSESTGDPTWAMIVVYENLNGDTQITSVEDLDITDPALLNSEDEAPENLAGGWNVTTPSSNPLAGDAQKVFAEAAESYAPVDLAPIALLGTQEGADAENARYLVLCSGTTVNGASPQLYVAQTVSDSSTGAQMASVELLDLLSYVDN